MRCSGDVQIIKDKMMLIQLEWMEIQMAKEKELKKLFEIEGGPIERKNIPDYIDPVFARENNISTDYNYIIKAKNNAQKTEKDENKLKGKKSKKKSLKMRKIIKRLRKKKVIKKIKIKMHIKIINLKRKNSIIFMINIEYLEFLPCGALFYKIIG